MAWRVTIFIIAVQLLGLSSISFSFSLDTITLNLSTDDRKPHLSCILFGDTACQISCDVLCDLYGCQSRATCVDDVSCDCGEIYTVNSRNLTTDRYRKLNLSELWRHHFGQSLISRRLLLNINRFDEVSILNLTALLRQPHITSHQVHSELLRIYPKWWLVTHLRPSRRGRINEIFDHDGISRQKFDVYFEKTITSIVTRRYSQILSMTNVNAFPSLFKYLIDDNNVRYLISQSLWYPNNTLLDLINEYSLRFDHYNIFPTVSNTNLSASDAETAAYEALKAHLLQGIENLAEQTFGKIQEMKQNLQLPRLTAFVRDKNDVRNVLSLMLMFPNASMFDLMRGLMMQKRPAQVESDTNTFTNRFSPQIYISPDDIDELVMASVLERLLREKLHSAKLARFTTFTTTTTTHEPTTRKIRAISNYFYHYVRRLWRKIFRIREPHREERGKTTKQYVNGKKKSYPDLRVLLTQLMEHLVQATNP